MQSTIPLLNGRRITIEQALCDDDNILAQIEYPRQRLKFFEHLSAHQVEIEAIVAFHLGVKKCRVGSVETWMAGSYNVCVPVYISPPSDVTSVYVRIPLPYKVGEAYSPGNADEKLRCEVASYLWMQENCPDVPIPLLFGCGLSDGQAFTLPERSSLLSRLLLSLRRSLLSWLRLPIPCRYICRRRQDTLRDGYILISRVSTGQMLSSSWGAFRHDKTRRLNLFHDLARITLSLTRISLPSIGSLTIDNKGFITLTNRPLTLQLQSLENEGIPTAISRRTTYPDTELYLLDLLSCHDNRIFWQPNSIHDKEDGEQQLAALTMMRAVLPHFTQRSHRHGPFAFTLTDLHQSNIFVDDQWHVTSLIDLEWACSLPIQFQSPPYWLSGRGIDQLEHGEHLEEFQELATEYIEAFEQEEKKTTTEPMYHTPIMRKCWETGSFWYFHAINSPKGLCRVFNEHIQRRFCPEHCDSAIFDEVVAPYWSVGASHVIERKVKEEAAYKNRLREAFASLEPS